MIDASQVHHIQSTQDQGGRCVWRLTEAGKREKGEGKRGKRREIPLLASAPLNLFPLSPLPRLAALQNLYFKANCICREDPESLVGKRVFVI